MYKVYDENVSGGKGGGLLGMVNGIGKAMKRK